MLDSPENSTLKSPPGDRTTMQRGLQSVSSPRRGRGAISRSIDVRDMTQQARRCLVRLAGSLTDHASANCDGHPEN